MSKRANLIGFTKKYFSVIEEVESHVYPSGAIARSWKCLCICGNEFTKETSYILGVCKSCGCMNFKDIQHKNQKVDSKDVSWNRILNSYMQRARRDGIIWSLAEEEARHLFSSKCYYCGIEPCKKVNAYITKSGRYITKNIERAEKCWITFNGIDRLDNDKGYIIDNCVACCYICNNAKSDLSLTQFENWLDNITKYRVSLKG